MEVVNSYLDGNRVVFLSRDEHGDRKMTQQRPDWSFYLRTADVGAETERQIKTSKYVVGVKVEGDYMRVSTRDRDCREVMITKALNDFKTFEGDVHPVRRAMVDRDVTIQRSRHAFFDLETDSRVRFANKEHARILSWSVVTENDTEFTGVLEEENDRAERVLIESFFKVCDPYDLLLAWNGEWFDFEVLFARIAHLRPLHNGQSVNIRHWLWLDQMVLFKRMNSAESGDEKQSLGLNAVAQALIGEGKDTFDSSKTYEAWLAGGEERERLVRYNLQDVWLQKKIEAKTGFVDLFKALCKVTNVFPETRGLKPTVQMDGFMFAIGKQRNVHFPTKRYDQFVVDSSQYEGAWVLKPPANVGILQDVHVADFASLYPSIIITFNMSPETKVGFLSKAGRDGVAPMPVPVPENVAISVTGCGFRTDVEGILPSALRTMIDMRKVWSAKQLEFPPGTPEAHEAELISKAYKVAANSFYGVIGASTSRFYDRDVAESVTLCGQWLLKITVAAQEVQGQNVLYGDTDSIFSNGCSRTDFGQFVDRCNTDLYPVKLRERGCVSNVVKLAYEKQFARLVFVAAKKYLGVFLHYKGKEAAANSKPEIKGLEYKRGDSVVLARRLQGALIELFRKGEMNVAHYKSAAQGYLEHIMNDELPLDEVKLSKSMSKGADEYGKTREDGSKGSVPTHVQVAKELNERGLDLGDGSRVSYVVIDASESPMRAIPAEDYEGILDRYYMWDSVFPPSQRLLAAMFPEHDWRTGFVNLRPKKLKTKHVNQLSLLGVAESTSDYVLDLPESVGERGIALVKRLLVKHPGQKRAVIRLQLESGSVAVLATNLYTSGAPSLVGKIRSAVFDDRVTTDLEREFFQ